MTQKDWLRPWTQQESFYRGQVRELLFHRLGSEALLQPQLLSPGGNWVLALCSWPWSNIHDLYFLWVSLFFHIFCLNKRLEWHPFDMLRSLRWVEPRCSCKWKYQQKNSSERKKTFITEKQTLLATSCGKWLKTYTNRYLLGLFINKGYFKYTTGFTEMCNQTFAEMCKHKAEDHMNEIKWWFLYHNFTKWAWRWLIVGWLKEMYSY